MEPENSPNVLFINCTLKPSPELSETGALWSLVAKLFRAKGCQTRELRPVDFNVLSGCSGHEGGGDECSKLLDPIRSADILIIGTPAIQGQRSSQCQRLMEHLQAACSEQSEPTTGQSPLYNTVAGVLQVGDAWGCRQSLAQTCFDLGQLGCVNPPHNTVAWCQPMDTDAGFTAAQGIKSATVHREARLLVEHALETADRLRQNPLQVNFKAIYQEMKLIAKATTVENGTLLTPQPIYTGEVARGVVGIHYRQIAKRVWTVMQAGQQRGFTFQVVDLEAEIFRAERGGRGFLFKTYPGYFAYRSRYANYDLEKSKTHKLALMAKVGLPVPISYGTFDTVADIPFESLAWPVVAKPDAGSLSENVFPNLQSIEQLIRAATVIETSGAPIKLESHIPGPNYRILIIDHHYGGCVQRRPASIVGDSQHTILELFHFRNQEPGRGDCYETHTTLHQLVFDHTSRRLLHQAGYTLETVLTAGEVFYLQEKITAALGSDYIDCTDDLHPSIIHYCVDFSYHFPSLTIGFDLITTDIGRPLTETRGAFNEYNTLPYVDLHEYCNVGQQRPVSRLIWDYIEANASNIVTNAFTPF